MISNFNGQFNFIKYIKGSFTYFVAFMHSIDLQVHLRLVSVASLSIYVDRKQFSIVYDDYWWFNLYILQLIPIV